ncbi:putative methyltransferase PMT [Trema orientale]|uniref:Putative methyltransferase PMT n=1 Tax=Trema orientale TaxID=63057 RepID=A0A2P5FNZ0_TREOI|nr:putative methyltransferase PMT [Trema orientale]
MPLQSKSRSNKRSSSSASYASTITMVVFVALCFLGVWMLTSNSVVPVPQTSTRATATTNSDESQVATKTETTTTSTSFEDTPGDLPDDAIKDDDPSSKQEPGPEDQQQAVESHLTLTDPSQQEQNNSTSTTTDDSPNEVVKAEESADDQEKNREQRQEDESNDNVVNTQVEDQLLQQEQQQEVESTSTSENTETEAQTESTTPETDQQETKTTTTPQNDRSIEHEFTDVTNQEIQPQKQDSHETKDSTAGTGTGSNSNLGESFPGGDNSGIPKESKESKKSWSTQAAQSENEKERRKDETDGQDGIYGYTWHLCNVTSGPDYIPCLDNEKALKQLHSTRHFEHRERHCPEEGPTCLVPVPEGYKRSIEWPASRDKIWYHNVPHTLLAEVKGHQNWVKVTGEFLTFPGGGTQFIHGALHYIDFLQQAVVGIGWGKRTRVILDVGCGVASFGGFLFERDVLAMSFAPKDEHEAQVQFALERGIPAISAVMGSQRLPFPSRVFDLVHCARCRVPWHAEGGMLLLELNRVLRPGGYFVWSATPVYQKLEEDVEIWKAMSSLTRSMCWELVTIKKDKLNSIGAAIYRKPTSNECYEKRKQKRPPMCKDDDDANAAWYVPLQSCMHRVPVDAAERGTQWPENWPLRLQTPPYWLNDSQMGIYGKPASQDFAADYEHWKRVVNNSYMSRLGISWSNVRNVMDMRAVYGGFAAAMKDLKVWVLNVVNVDSPDTLPIIYERGLFGIYHDWCESFSTYPRTYDLLHADHLFSKLTKRCKLAPVLAEVDRIVRPGGKLIVRDESRAIGEVENSLKSLHWEVRLTFSKNQEGILSAQKGDWRPNTYANSS